MTVLVPMHSWQIKKLRGGEAITKSMAISQQKLQNQNQTKKLRTSLNNFHDNKTSETQPEKEDEIPDREIQPEKNSIKNKVLYIDSGDTKVILYFMTGSRSKCRVDNKVTISYWQDTEEEFENNI